MHKDKGLAAYIFVTLAYWTFMLSDGALRMLVLYEVAGIVTNLAAGWIAARFGLSSTLFAGLCMQILALLALNQLDPAWSISLSVVFVMLVQGVSGIAKDLAKMSLKSAVKLLAPKAKGGLF
jgi:predicted MFS family arabinose efflux permease